MLHRSTLKYAADPVIFDVLFSMLRPAEVVHFKCRTEDVHGLRLAEKNLTAVNLGTDLFKAECGKGRKRTLIKTHFNRQFINAKKELANNAAVV